MAMGVGAWWQFFAAGWEVKSCMQWLNAGAMCVWVQAGGAYAGNFGLTVPAGSPLWGG